MPMKEFGDLEMNVRLVIPDLIRNLVRLVIPDLIRNLRVGIK